MGTSPRTRGFPRGPESCSSPGADLDLVQRVQVQIPGAIVRIAAQVGTVTTWVRLVMRSPCLGADVVSERADDPTLPELVSAPEVAEILGGITCQRVHQLQSALEFPAPLYRLRAGPVWDARAIHRFASVWVRKPGRPAGSKGTQVPNYKVPLKGAIDLAKGSTGELAKKAAAKKWNAAARSSRISPRG